MSAAAFGSMVTRTFSIPLFALLFGCVSALGIDDYLDWQHYGYDGFARSIDEVAGTDARNCGVYNLMSRDSRAAAESAGIQCARAAYEQGVAFKFGTVRLPIDSYAHEVLVRSSTGENWLIVYDIMIDGAAPQIWFQKCESVTFEGRNVTYEGNHCIEYDGSDDLIWNRK
ncbi:MAG: hypothetical protein AAF351_00320 [Pseudomonadota bacterium]